MTSSVKSFLESASLVHVHFVYAEYRKRGSQSSRRLIMLISVGWVPPDLWPSGAGLDRGTRVSCSRFTPARMAPNRGCLSSDRRSVHPLEWGFTARTRRFARHVHLTGDGPDAGRHVSGERHHHLVGMCPPCREVSETLASSHLGFPPDVLDGLWELLQAQLEM